MAIQAMCPTCEHSYSVPDGQAGKRVKCRNCADTFTVKVPERDDEDEDRGGSSRGRADRDEDDRRPDRKRKAREDEDDRPRKKKKADDSSTVMPVLIIVGGVFLLILVGGGIAVLIASFGRSAGPKPGIAQNPNNNPNPVVNQGPGKRHHFHPPKNLDEALEDLREQGQDDFMRHARCGFIAEQQPIEGRRDEVCNALWAQQQREGHGQDAARGAFLRWAGKNQQAQILELVGKGREDAVELAVRLKLTQVGPVLVQRLQNDRWGHNRDTIFRNLELLGSASTDKEVLKLVSHPSQEVRDQARTLLRNWNVNQEILIDQYLADLSVPNQATSQIALENLAKTTLEVKKQAEVVKALKPFMVSVSPGVSRAATQVAVIWGNNDLVPELARALDVPRSSTDREEIMKALVRINSEPARQALVAQLGTTHSRTAAPLIIKAGAIFEPLVIEFLNRPNGTSTHRRAALQILKEIGTEMSIPAIQLTGTRERTLMPEANSTIAAIQARIAKP